MSVIELLIVLDEWEVRYPPDATRATLENAVLAHLCRTNGSSQQTNKAKRRPHHSSAMESADDADGRQSQALLRGGPEEGTVTDCGRRDDQPAATVALVKHWLQTIMNKMMKSKTMKITQTGCKSFLWDSSRLGKL